MFFVEDKLVGRSRALVIDNRDPEQRGQIQVNHPMLGETVWIPYLKSPGAFDVPSIGDIVYVECDSGHHEYPVAWGNLTKGASASPEIPIAFQREVPTNRGFYTPEGHLIEFDDGVATATQDPSSSTKTTESKGIRITTADGSKLQLNDDSDNNNTRIVLSDADGNSIIIDRHNGSMDLTVEGKFNVSATAESKIVSTSHEVDSPATTMTGTLDVDGNVTAKANLTVTGNSSLGGGTPLTLSTAQFIGTGNLGGPVISSIMSGLSTTATGG